ncbi:hypothetical protein BHE74_00036513 [Ensete ventricosum]|nr:hypothetical protein BHE74_00036513 [Ensete ventricosum]RZR90271.1 hypothetical protein BHM03_00018121 [Ensete ventricosum]
MWGSGLNLVTTVIGFGMSATFIVFVCTRLLCSRIRSTDSRATPFDIELRSDIDQVRRRPVARPRALSRTLLIAKPKKLQRQRLICQQPEHSIGGLEPVLVDAIPTMKYKLEAFSSREDAQ